MEYTVGSLADLITGSNAPNKPKVVKKLVNRKEKVHSEKPPVSPSPSKKSKKLREEVVTSDFIHLTPSRNEEEGTVEPREESEGVDGKSVRGRKLELSQNEVNARRRLSRKKNPEKSDDPEVSARTLFVGNVPANLTEKEILQYFKKYGFIKSVKIRGLVSENPKVPKKVAAFRKQLHPKRKSVVCYVRFKNKEDCLKALVENGKIFEGHHLRVSTCEERDKPDQTRAIFVGNLNFDAEEEELWELFKDFGPISYVRVIRDSQTMKGKGFAYVNFRDSDSAQLALEMKNVQLRDRTLRILPCNSVAKKNKNSGNKKQPGKPQKMRWINMDKKTEDIKKKRKRLNELPMQQNGENKNKKRKRLHELLVQQHEQYQKFLDLVSEIVGYETFSAVFPMQQSEESQDSQFIKKKKQAKMNNVALKKGPTQHSKEFQGSKFTDKKKKRVGNKGLLEKKKKIKKVAPK